MLDKPAFLLQVEGWAILTASLAAYRQLDGSWAIFFLLFLWPDVFMLGYLLSPRFGRVAI
jgi:hypothetical protein